MRSNADAPQGGAVSDRVGQEKEGRKEDVPGKQEFPFAGREASITTEMVSTRNFSFLLLISCQPHSKERFLKMLKSSPTATSADSSFLHYPIGSL